MPLTVRFFAAARAAAGVEETSMELPAAGVTLGALEHLLMTEFPGLDRVLPRCSYLRDEVALCDRDRQIEPTVRVVDVLPPFAGG